jgi:hypothetical protein
MDQIAAPPAAVAPSPAAYHSVVAWARERATGPLAWFGELPETRDMASDSEPPALLSRPLRAGRPRHQASLLGLAVPVADRTFSVVVALDYWQELSDTALRFICDEFTRIAATCVLATSRPSPAPADRSAALASFTIDSHDLPDARVQVIRRSGKVEQ